MNKFRAKEIPITLAYQTRRKRDLYISLVGELFSNMKATDTVAGDWAQLGNAFGYYADTENLDEILKLGINPDDAKLYAATAFYLGGFPASAYLLLKNIDDEQYTGARLACIELLIRPTLTKSTFVSRLKNILIKGDSDLLSEISDRLSHQVPIALSKGPDKWIPMKLLEHLFQQFNSTSLRAVLPETGDSSFWDDLIRSFVRRGVWDFFPSQIHAINSGLLTSTESFSLQMPTGAGKTALCETLLYSHLKSNPESVAVLLVPYRSLASELRKSLVAHLNQMGISARCAYGGTVPTGEEVSSIDDIRALVATPESLSGMLSANADFAKRISLVICDEGHLLDSGERGVGLELLLAKIRARKDLATARYVFASAIVPNIEEINSWLGGTAETVIRSEYRPAIAEFSCLNSPQDNTVNAYDLMMHPQHNEPLSYRIEGFLRRTDFQWFKIATGRMNTYAFSSIKTRAVAAARKALPLGASVIFSANKRGNQGVVGIVEELLKQCECSIKLPAPINYTNKDNLKLSVDYVSREYGPTWLGTRALRQGCAMHHGDIPQETREIIEGLLRDRDISFCVCTNTLAEGVNLPIRTLVLYSVQRLGAEGKRTDMLTRDIKNLVGRAGRAGSTTKGLVICANEDQWHMVKEVALESRGEEVQGALSGLIRRLQRAIPAGEDLTNDMLEGESLLYGLIDGIDSTLIELFAEQIGEVELLEMANTIANETFAAKNLEGKHTKLLTHVFHLRVKRLQGLNQKNQLSWARATGAKPRFIEGVNDQLYSACNDWTSFKDSCGEDLVDLLVPWALKQKDMEISIQRAFQLDDTEVSSEILEKLKIITITWLSGNRFFNIADSAKLPVDEILGIYTSTVSYALQTVIEQAVALVGQITESQGIELAKVASEFPEHLRYGVPTVTGLTLASAGIRHRQGYVYLGNELERIGIQIRDKDQVLEFARTFLKQEPAVAEAFRGSVGELVYKNTLQDLTTKRKRKIT